MRPGPDRFFKCPNCDNVLSKGSIKSGNNFGAKLYSDSKQIASMLPEFPAISKCSECNTIFWLNDKTEIKKSTFTKIEQAQFLTIYEYLSVLENNNYETENEKYFVAQQIWWLFNDRVRNGNPIFNSDNDEQIWRENIHRLIALLDDEDINQRIMTVELNRNLGNFQKCRDYLSTISDSNFESVIKLFEKEIADKNTKVFQLR